MVQITATVGDVTGTYAISTSSVFESAAGYWTFEDPANLGKAIRGVDLTELNVEIVEGPSATKKAIQVVDRQPALKWEHNLTIVDHAYSHPYGYYGYKTANATVLFDVRPTVQWADPFAGREVGSDRIASPLYWNEYGENYCFGIRNLQGALGVYANGSPWKFEDMTTELMTVKPWYRIVIRICPAYPGDPGYNPEDANDPFRRAIWVNGVLIADEIRGDNSYYRAGFIENAPIWFLTGSDRDRNAYNEARGYYDYAPMPCSTIAVWDRLLTDDEIIALGGVSR
jgi:hypothetical protein